MLICLSEIQVLQTKKWNSWEIFPLPLVFIFWLLCSNGELRRHSPFQILQRTFCEPIGSVYFGRTTDTAKRIIFILRTVNIQGNHRVKKFLNTADFIHFRVLLPRCIKMRFIQELNSYHSKAELKCLLFKKGQNVEVQVFFTINKKSTIFVQFCSNFQELIYPWAGQTLKVWAKSVKKCRFFINGEKNLHFYILTFLKQQTF